MVRQIVCWGTIFKARTRLLQVRNNYWVAYENNTCSMCKSSVEIQKHILCDCPQIHNTRITKVNNDEILSQNVRIL